MKRILQLFSLAVMLPFAAQSQITIEADDIEMVGYLAINSRDSFPDSTIVIGGTGMQTWDFSTLQNDAQDTLRFYEAPDVPHADEFPLANIGVTFGPALYVFFEKTDDHLATYGSFGTLEYGPFNITTAFKYNPPLTAVKFPMQLNNAFDETVYGKIQVPGSVIGVSNDSVRVIKTNRRSVTIDAFGDLTTPTGTYPTLRSKEIEITADTIYILSSGIWFPAQSSTPDTFTYYSWWTNQNGLGYPVAQFSVRNSGQIKTAGWLNSIVSSTNNPSPLLKLGLSPNPASDFLNVELPENTQGSLEVYDMNGRLQQTTAVSSTMEQMNVQHLVTGSYVLVLKDKRGNPKGFERFEIIR